MANIRLTIVMRRDLKMPIGLFGAQCAHTADQFEREKLGRNEAEVFEEEMAWVQSPYLSVLAVETLDDLELIIEDAKTEGLSVRVWEDTLPSPTFPDRFIKTKVGVSLGPDDFDAIKIVTGSLPLY